MYGYDAGVLGGVQETKPFLHAMGVRFSWYQTTTTRLTIAESDWNIRGSYDRIFLHTRSCNLLARRNHDRNASWPTHVHSSRQWLRNRWWFSPGFCLVRPSYDCGKDPMCKYHKPIIFPLF